VVHERLGSRKNGGRDVWLGQAVVGCCPAGPKGLAFTPASIRLRQVGEIKRFLLRDFFVTVSPFVESDLPELYSPIYPLSPYG